MIRPFHFYIENFRDNSFDLGKKLTVISVQNGVGKSNIVSLIASSSGVNTKSMLGSNFQPEFTDFFNIDAEENYEEYKLYLTYVNDNGEDALTKRLAFKNDTKTGRGIRIIPRTTNVGQENCTIKEAEEKAKLKYGVGGAGRVKIPTIYLSLSRLYPLGEQKEKVKISKVSKKNMFYQKRADEKYKEWYNYVVPNSIANDAILSIVEKIRVLDHHYIWILSIHLYYHNQLDKIMWVILLALWLIYLFYQIKTTMLGRCYVLMK